MSKVILLTGASRGIGLAIAHYLLSHSHSVTLLARSEAPLLALQKQYPTQTAILPGDLSDPNLAQTAIKLTIQTFGRLDGVVVNQAVLDPVKRIADSSVEEWREAYNVNFFSAVAIVQAAIPHLRESSHQGKIIFTSSGAATNCYATWGAYGSSKAALNHLAGSIASEEPGIVALSVRPGVVDTKMQRDIRGKYAAVMEEKDRVRFGELKATGELLRPEQPGHVIAKLVLEAPKELSGRFLSWNAEELKVFQE